MSLNNELLGLDIGAIASLTLASLSLDTSTKQLNTVKMNKQQNDNFQNELITQLGIIDNRFERIEKLLEEISNKL